MGCVIGRIHYGLKVVFCFRHFTASQLCFLLMTFVPVQKLCFDIYIYICALLYEFCFLWFTNCVLLSNDNSLIPGCLWLLAFVLNNTLILGIWCFTIPHRWSNHLPPACGSTFWKSIIKHQFGYRFDILNSISSFCCILTYAIIYVLVHHIIFWLYLYFLNFYFIFSSTPVLASSIDVVFVLSILS